MDLSIIILNYMTSTITAKTIQSVLKFTENIDFEIILVDNASKCEDVKKLEEYIHDKIGIMLIKNKKNVGFGSGNNIAYKYTSGKYILFINSDCELTDNTLYKAISFMNKHVDIAAVGTRVITPDGKLDNGCKRGFPSPRASLYYFLGLHKLSKNPKYDQYKLFHLDEYKVSDVDVISGAFILARKSVLDQVGVFDEDFFMYGEDIDLCYRIKQAGYRIVYNPELGNVIHYRGQSSKYRKFKTIYNFYEAMIIFYRKHYKKNSNILTTSFVYTAVILLCMVKMIKNIFPRSR